MTNEASPRPWRAEPSGRVGTDCIFDANGVYVCTVAKCDSALICAAVNKHGMPIVELIKAYDALEAERDRLRDLVRRLYQMCCEDWAHTNAEGHALLREARAAIGEGETPTGKGVER